MKTSIDILKSWFQEGDKPTETQFGNLIDSFHHKDDGHIIKEYTIMENGNVSFVLTDGETVTIEKFVLPNTMPTSFIDGLVDLLNTKVDKETGKQLSSENFTQALKQKLEQLENYTHPDTHAISEVDGLQAALDEKVDKVTGKQLSDENFTNQEKTKLAGLENYTAPASQPITYVEGLSDALNQIDQDLTTKVDKIDGKELSSNDFTDDEKQKLADLNPTGFGEISDGNGNSFQAEGQADLLTIEGVTLDIVNKKVTVNSPTKVSELQNDIPFALQGDPIRTGNKFQLVPKQAGIQITRIGAIKIAIPTNIGFNGFTLYIDISTGYHGVDKISATIIINAFIYTYSAGTGFHTTSARIIASDKKYDFKIRFHAGTNPCIYIGELDTDFRFANVAITKVVGNVNGSLDDVKLNTIQQQLLISKVSSFEAINITHTDNLIQGKQSDIAITDENETAKFYATDKISFGGNVEFDSGNKRINIIGGGDVNFTDGNISRIYKKQSLNYANTTGALCITVPYGIRSYHIKTLAYNYGSATDLTEYKIQGYTVNSVSWFYPTVQKTGTDQRTVRLYAGDSQYRIYIGELTDNHPFRAGLFVEEVLSLIGGDPTMSLSIETSFIGTLKATF